MSANFYGPDDAFGVPARMLRLSDDFYGALGRVAALGALVELRMSNVVVLWGKDPGDEGRLMRHLTQRFEEIKKARLQAGYELPGGLVSAVAAASAAMKERDELLHSLWPAEASGWRNRPGGTVTTKYKGLPAVRAAIARLVIAVDGLGPFLRSPID